MTVPELQELCEKLNLSSEGLKRELIARLINYTPNADENIDQTTQTGELRNTPTSMAKVEKINQSTPDSSKNYFNDAVLKWIFAVGFVVVVGAMVLMLIFNVSNEKIEINVKRPWLPWF